MASNPIGDLRKKLEKRFKDSTEVFPDFSSVRKVDVIPSGSALLDAVTGLGGFPRGRMTELYGGYSTGKTTVATHASAEAQRGGGVVLYVDYEHAFDAAYAHALGVRLGSDVFVFCQPDYFEQGDIVIDSFVAEGLVDLIVVDSAAAMTPLEDMEGKIDSTGRIGLQAQLMSRMLARITKKISKGRKPALLMINQTRMKIDTKNARNNGEQSAAGSAIKFYASMRLGLENITGEGDDNRGKGVTDQVYTQNRVRVTAVKNKLAPPWMRGQFTLEYGRGINNILSVAELAEQRLGLLNSQGYFSYKGDSPETTITGRGRDNFQAALLSNPALFKELEKKVLAMMSEEHAKSLGVGVLSRGEDAKELEDAGVITLLEEARPKPTVLAEGDGLPVEDV